MFETARRSLLLSLIPALQGLEPARAQSGWPDRPIRLIVPYAAGGSTDVLARILADSLGQELGAPLIIENRGGAGATIGAAAVAQAAPDGYTLVMSNSGSHGVSPHLYRNPGYDPIRDFTHIALVARTPHVLVVNSRYPANSLAEFISRAREAGEMRFAVAGIGASSHLLGVRLGLATGIPVEPVAYRGAGPAANDVIAGVLPAMFDSVPSATSHITSGMLRPLAVSGDVRSGVLPAVPTLREEGVDIISYSWFGLSGPGGLSTSIQARIAGAVRTTLERDEVQQRLILLGADSPRMTPAEYTAFVETELASWGAVIQTADIKI